MIGDRGLISRTENQGLNWEEVSSGYDDVNLKDIAFFNENDGLIIGEGGMVLISSDGGFNWQK